MATKRRWYQSTKHIPGGVKRYYYNKGQSGSDKMWFNCYNQLHRDNGPAIELRNGTREWYQNDQLHRTNGPAIITQKNIPIWYVNGEELDEELVYNWYDQNNLEPKTELNEEQELLFKLTFG